MPSQNSPAHSIRDRVLHATLARVSKRRTRRRRALGSFAAILALSATAFWWARESPSPDTVADPNRHTVPAPSAAEPAPPTIERLSAAPLRRIEFISTDSSSTIERIPTQPESQPIIERISDDQLFSSLPATQSVALISNPDGTSRLIVFAEPAGTDSL